MSESQLPSSATNGFFQSFPNIPAQYESEIAVAHSKNTDRDPLLPKILKLYLPQPIPAAVDKHLHNFAKTCLDPETLRLAVDAERNPPTLYSQTTFGAENRTNALQTSEGWRGLKQIQTCNGLTALGYAPLPEVSKLVARPDPALPSTHASTPTSYNRRIHQFAVNHLWTPSSATVNCPASMSDGAAILLGRHLDDPDGDQVGRAEVLAEARRRLLSFNPEEAWTSGQWMTERSGGSDVRGTETVARKLTEAESLADGEGNERLGNDAHGMPLGPWKVDGFKWFSSATDSDMAVLLARTGREEISAFYAPMWRFAIGHDGEAKKVLNGVRISRLKDKLGTKSLPTAELELKGMRAWLIGEQGKGVKEISAVLNSTRLWTAGGALGSWSRALAAARAYAKVRKVKGYLLADNALHCAWMAEETVKYHAAAHLFFLGVALQGVSEQGEEAVAGTTAQSWLPPTRTEAEILLRVLTPVIKAQCSAASVAGVRHCLESLGGIGYCENNDDGGVLNIARLYRDVTVNVIWEGTASVLAEDLVRAMLGRPGGETWKILDACVRRILIFSRTNLGHEHDTVLAKWAEIQTLVSSSNVEKITAVSRQLMQEISTTITAALLLFTASKSGSTIDCLIASRWIKGLIQPPRPISELQSPEVAMDRSIFLAQGDEYESVRSKM